MPRRPARELSFQNAHDVRAEIGRLRSGNYRRTGNWNLTNICDHLDRTMSGGLDGFGFRLPWLLRATIIKWLFARVLKKGRMPAGASTLKRLKPQTGADQEDPAIIDRCLATIDRAEAHQGMMKDYPFLDNFSAETWREFMWLHAAHHLGYLVPGEGETSTGDV